MTVAGAPPKGGNNGSRIAERSGVQPPLTNKTVPKLNRKSQTPLGLEKIRGPRGQLFFLMKLHNKMQCERQNLDGANEEQEARATGQPCPCRYVRKVCTFNDMPSLRSRIYQADSGQLDDEPGLKDLVMDAYWNYIEHEHLKQKGLQKLQRKRTKKHAGHELGAREFTLTYSPQWCTDEQARILMTQAVDRLMQYCMNEIVEFHAVGEVTKQGCSHIHGYYLLHGGLKITDKQFKRAYKFWNPKKLLGKRGFEGGHHEVVQRESDFKSYIDKCPDAWLRRTFTRDKTNADEDEST